MLARIGAMFADVDRLSDDGNPVRTPIKKPKPTGAKASPQPRPSPKPKPSPKGKAKGRGRGAGSLKRPARHEPDPPDEQWSKKAMKRPAALKPYKIYKYQYPNGLWAFKSNEKGSKELLRAG